MNIFDRVRHAWLFRGFTRRFPGLLDFLPRLLRLAGSVHTEVGAHMQALVGEMREYITARADALKHDLAKRLDSIRIRHEAERKALEARHEARRTPPLTALFGRLHCAPWLNGAQVINMDAVSARVSSRRAISALQEQLRSCPRSSVGSLVVALLIIALGGFGNYFMFQTLLGPDWVMGDEQLTTAVNAGGALLLELLIVIGLERILSAIGEERAGQLEKRLQIGGGALLVIGLLLIMGLRITELGSALSGGVSVLME